MTLPQAAAVETPSQDKTRTMRILVLDDNELDRQRLLRLCRRAGLSFDATEAVDLASFRKAVAANEFDLVFLDYFLPGETGIEAISILSEFPNQADAAVIMLAGEGQLDVAVEAMRLGCADYLTKNDLSPESLQKSVASAFERKMLMATASHERDKRERMEAAVERYASSCTVEMRSVLAGMLRRLRMLRRFEDGRGLLGNEVQSIEERCDMLWNIVAGFKTGAIASIAGAGGDRPQELAGPPHGSAKMVSLPSPGPTRPAAPFRRDADMAPQDADVHRLIPDRD